MVILRLQLQLERKKPAAVVSPRPPSLRVASPSRRLSPALAVHRLLERLEHAPRPLLTPLDRAEAGRLEGSEQRAPDLLARRRDKASLRDLAVEEEQGAECDRLRACRGSVCAR